MLSSIKSLITSIIFIALFISGQTTYAEESFDWSGAYAGLSVGARKVDADWTTTTYLSPPGGTLPFFGDPSTTLQDTEPAINGYVGYNWLSAYPNVVFGMDANIGNANNNNKLIAIPGVFSTTSYITTDTSWNANLRGRLGYLLTPRLLFYGTAGAAVARIKSELVCPADTFVCNPAFGTTQNSRSNTMLGWTLGAGVETFLTENLQARIEYSYTDYGTMDFDVFPPNPVRTFGIKSEIQYTSQSVMFGIGYKF